MILSFSFEILQKEGLKILQIISDPANSKISLSLNFDQRYNKKHDCKKALYPSINTKEGDFVFFFNYSPKFCGPYVDYWPLKLEDLEVQVIQS